MSLEGLKVLVVSNDFPYPPNHGGRVDIWGRIHLLLQLGCEVDVVATINSAPAAEEVAAVESRVADLMLVARASNVTGIFSRRPLQVVTRDALRRVRFERAYDVVIMEAEPTCSVLDNPTLRAAKRIIRVHNDEAGFFRDLAASEKSFYKRAYYFVEAHRYDAYSPQVFAAVDMLWFSSFDEYHRYANRHAGKGLPPSPVFVPVPLERRAKARPLAGGRVLFLGTLTAATNVEGIDWYLQHIHPQLLGIEGYSFVIAGNTRGKDVRALVQEWASCPQVTVIQNPEDVEHLYDGSMVFVNPMLHGNSIKVKTVHAVDAGLPVVTTTVGNEGTGFTHGQQVMVADSAQDFVAGVRQFVLEPARAREFVRRGQEFLRAHYDCSRIMRDTLTSLFAAPSTAGKI